VSVVTAGEALVDLAPRGDQLLPLPGGSPYNVAVGLARLEVATHFLGRLSTDGFGRRLRSGLEQEGVDLGAVVATDDPTTLAVVHLDDQAHASYAFYLDGTSAAGLRTSHAALPAEAALHVSFGAIGLEHPAGEALVDLVRASAGGRVRSLDPNVRPSAITELTPYGTAMEELVVECDLVKVSDEDLTLLYPGRDPAESAAAWAASGPAIVVMTRGADGSTAFTAAGRHVDVAAPAVEVVDTVGAGDAFTAGLLAWLDERGHLAGRERLDELAGSDDLPAALAFAGRVAGLTCTRAGADPPTRSEIDAGGADQLGG
jgi:fructokinase